MFIYFTAMSYLPEVSLSSKLKCPGPKSSELACDNRSLTFIFAQVYEMNEKLQAMGISVEPHEYLKTSDF